MTPTKITTADLTVLGSVLGGALLEDWHGPVSALWSIDDGPTFMADGVLFETTDELDGMRCLWYCNDPHIHADNRAPAFLRLDLMRSEVRDRVVRVLAAGLECENCEGSGEVPYDDGYASFMGPCPKCDGDGRDDGHDLTHITAAERRGDLEPWEAAGLLWVSVLRVEAGMAPCKVGDGYPMDGDVDAIDARFAADGRATIRRPGFRQPATAIVLPHPDGVRLLVVP